MTEESKHGGVTPLGSASAGGKFLTVAEVAATLRVSKMSVYRLIHSGSLEAVRFGRSFRVAEKALDSYLAGSYYDAG
jgi:excisionase family DNA binding protein